MSDQEAGTAELAVCREEIDRLDVQILHLLNERTRIVERIGSIKRRMRMAVYEPKREDQVFANVLEHNAGPLPADAVRRVFERIIDEMRSVQQQRILEAQQGRGTTEC